MGRYAMTRRKTRAGAVVPRIHVRRSVVALIPGDSTTSVGNRSPGVHVDYAPLDVVLGYAVLPTAEAHDAQDRNEARGRHRPRRRRRSGQALLRGPGVAGRRRLLQGGLARGAADAPGL